MSRLLDLPPMTLFNVSKRTRLCMDEAVKTSIACSGNLVELGLLVLGIRDDQVVANGVDQPF